MAPALAGTRKYACVIAYKRPPRVAQSRWHMFTFAYYMDLYHIERYWHRIVRRLDQHMKGVRVQTPQWVACAVYYCHFIGRWFDMHTSSPDLRHNVYVEAVRHGVFLKAGMFDFRYGRFMRKREQRVQQKMLALCMSVHPRLGKDSPFNLLEVELMEMIRSFL